MKTEIKTLNRDIFIDLFIQKLKRADMNPIDPEGTKLTVEYTIENIINILIRENVI